MNVRYAPLLVLALFVALAGCTNRQTDAPQGTSQKPQAAHEKPAAQRQPAARAEVRVAAAANLKFVFEPIETAFERQYPDIDLKVTYGSSGNFLTQLTQRAPFDVFLSADTQSPQKLVELGLATKDSLFVYAVGQLVLWVPTNSPLDLEKLGMQALTQPSVKKIAIANPRLAPYGQAAEAAMKHVNVYETAKDRLVLGDNISQTAQFVESGAADIGILALSLAIAPELKSKGRFWIVPTDSFPPIEQAGVILSWAGDAAAAGKLRTFLTGTEGRKILAEFGYRAPGG